MSEKSIKYVIKEGIGRVYSCVGCGWCCIVNPCAAALRLNPHIKKCPHLLWKKEEKKYRCDLMEIDGPFGPHATQYKKDLNAGTGCSSTLFNDWREDVKERDLIDRNSDWNPIDPVLQTFIKCLSNNFITNDTILLTLSQMKADLKNKTYTDREIEHISKSIIHMFKQNKNSYMEEFMR